MTPSAQGVPANAAMLPASLVGPHLGQRASEMVQETRGTDMACGVFAGKVECLEEEITRR